MSPHYNDEYPTLYDDDYNNNVNIEEIYDNSIDNINIGRQDENTPEEVISFPLRMPAVSPKEVI